MTPSSRARKTTCRPATRRQLDADTRDVLDHARADLDHAVRMVVNPAFPTDLACTIVAARNAAISIRGQLRLLQLIQNFHLPALAANVLIEVRHRGPIGMTT
jgi:hypothetical protein